jgi:exopolysaccharide production protein ExoZ
MLAALLAASAESQVVHGKFDSKTMHGIQALRFFAAFGVFVHHTFIHADNIGVIPHGVAPYTYVAASGVLVFFVLSGFLMAKISETATPGRFLIERAIRLYPGLWLAIGLSVTATYLVFGAFYPREWFYVLTLLPDGYISYPLRIEWSLVFEVYFYCIVAALCFIPKIWIRQTIVVAWALLILTHGAGISHGTFVTIPLSYLNLSFILGMASWWLQAILPFRGYTGALLAAAVFAAGRYMADTAWLTGHLLQSSAAAIIVLTASRASFFDRLPIFTRLGDASYGLYLIQVPIITTVFVAAGLSGWIWFFAVFVFALASGIAFGLLDFGIHKVLKDLTRNQGPMMPFDVSAACKDATRAANWANVTVETS